MIDKKKKGFIFVTVLLSCAAIALLSAALGTDFWVDSYPERQVSDDIIGIANNLTDGQTGTKFTGRIHFGLFHGYQALDSGFGIEGREVEIWTACVESRNLCGMSRLSDPGARRQEIQSILDFFDNLPSIISTPSPDSNTTVPRQISEHGLFNFGLWLCTIIFLALGLVWGLVSLGFAIFNISTRPIETITGPMGLYLWNGLAVLFSFLSFVMYLSVYLKDIRYNVLHPSDRQNYWTSEYRTWPHYSFYLVVAATGLYIMNLLLLFLSGIKLKPVRFRSDINEKTLDGVMMY